MYFMNNKSTPNQMNFEMYLIKKCICSWKFWCVTCHYFFQNESFQRTWKTRLHRFSKVRHYRARRLVQRSFHVNTFKSVLHNYDQTIFIYDRRNNNDDVGNTIVVTFCCYDDNNEENVNLNSDYTKSIWITIDINFKTNLPTTLDQRYKLFSALAV